MFWTKAWPAITTLAPRSVLSPRIGRKRRFSWPWSASSRLLAYCSVRCQAAGATSSSTLGYTAALSVTTSTLRFVELPAVADRVPARPGRLSQQRSEPLHPAEDRDLVDLDAAFGE